MRRALLASWPALSRFFGLYPWDVDRLTVDELNGYLRAIDAHGREMERAAAEARRKRR